ncbi:MAG TPA: hypothetical protein ENJ07_02895 [Gammaproteobacteria bacterium]|nr:hypothetical protein [Gammaproteobacteria bacterium]
MTRINCSNKDLSQRLSKRLANFKLKDDVISKITDRILIDGLELKKFDICTYGICIDYYTDKVPKLDGILAKVDVAQVEIFPYGIIDWDRFQVRVGFTVDELEGFNGGNCISR